MSTEILDLSAARVERARSRSARREGRGEHLTIRFEGREIATVGPEFPLDVLAPLQDINLDIALLVRQAIDIAAAEDSQQQVAMLGMIVDVLAANPQLPKEFVEAVKEMGRRLLGEEGYEQLVALRPTPWDVGSLITHLLKWYGISLGESSGSSEPSNSGGTSNTTSKPISDSTPETSGGQPETPASSESAA